MFRENTSVAAAKAANRWQRRRTTCCTWLLAILSASGGAAAQVPSHAPEATRERSVGIYVDCDPAICDLDFLRTDIAFVTHIRDRHDADVHVLVTSEPTAEGGAKITLQFIGQQQFRGVDDTLQYISRPADPAERERPSLGRRQSERPVFAVPEPDTDAR